MSTTELKTANLSYCVALIPTSPIKDLVASASLAITERFDNKNIIDNQRFPAHVSLHIGGTDREFIGTLTSKLKIATQPYASSQFIANCLYKGFRGFIGVSCVSDQFPSLIQTVIETCAELHYQYPRYRPHHLERWPRLSQIEQDLIRQYGTYKLGSSAKLHLSVAQVKDIYIDNAFRIAQDLIILPQEFGVEAIQLVDVGHNNEKWDVLCQW